MVLLGISRLALRVLPFRYIAGILDRSLLPGKCDVPDRKRKRRSISWAIARGSDLLPGNTVCFPQGIAAHVMCLRRGIDTTLYYGAAIRPDTGLTAHVWLQDGSTGVVGTRVADKYFILAQFPMRS
jgi:hypothetical protein